MQDVTITSFAPGLADDAVWDAYYALRRLYHDEAAEDIYFRSSAEMRDDLSQVTWFLDQRRWIAQRNDEVIGYLFAAAVLPACSSYNERRHIVEADLYVTPGQRRRGVARRMLGVLRDFMEENCATVATMRSSVAQGQAFLRALGAEEKMRDIRSRLVLARLDWDMVFAWRDGLRRALPGCTMMIHAGRVPESEWMALMPAINAGLRDIPVGELDGPCLELTAEIWRDWYIQFDRRGVEHHMIVLHDTSGVVAGVTDVEWSPREPGRVGQILTAVRRDVRGRGLARGIKAAMLLHIRNHFPAVTELVTSSPLGNEPMLAINHRLGFTNVETSVIYQIGRDVLP